jgi:hypothetical protein
MPTPILPPVWNSTEFPKVVLPVHLGIKLVVPDPVTVPGGGAPAVTVCTEGDGTLSDRWACTARLQKTTATTELRNMEVGLIQAAPFDTGFTTLTRTRCLFWEIYHKTVMIFAKDLRGVVGQEAIAFA